MILFGTGGIRGIMKTGEFDENLVKTVSTAIGKYMKDHEMKSVVIAYDTRLNSSKFARLAAEAFSRRGVDVFLFREPVPTPVLSFAVRHLKANLGVVITASHNPPEYNGYKVYTSNGVQAVPEVTDLLAEYIKNANLKMKVTNKGRVNILDDSVVEKFVDKCFEILVEEFGEKTVDLSGFKVVYSPLHGTGAKPVKMLLEKLGCEVICVQEQMNPDGKFPTVQTPNPEEDGAMTLVKKYCLENQTALGIATDPDCDRVGIIYKSVRLTGNEVGVLFTSLRFEKTNYKLPKDSYIVKTIVSTEMVRPMCLEYSVELVETPTGFKFIGDYIEKNPQKKFLLGFEESCGYLLGDHARDKDGVIASALIAIVAKNFDLLDKLKSLCSKYGYHKEELLSYSFNSVEEATNLYERIKTQTKVPDLLRVIDYSKGFENVIPNETIRLDFSFGKLFIRPSGTEPKLKVYAMTVGKDQKEVSKNMKKLREVANKILR